jgi:sulfate adenylyltransferase
MVVPLVDRVRRPAAPEEFAGLPSLEVSDDVARWTEALATGVFSPLEGFQHEEDIRSVLRDLALPDGHVWSLPVVFAPPDDGVPRLPPGQEILFTYGGRRIALFAVEAAFPFDVDAFASSVLGTTSPEHAGVSYLRKAFGPRAYAGKVTLLGRPSWGILEPFRLEPKDARQLFAERGWRTVVAFQTTNPPHRAYEYIHRTVLEMFDGLFIHPVVDTVRAKYDPRSILEGYRTLIDHYYRPERVVLGAWRTKMLFAGPREALHHAIVRRNFGCTHLVVGRRHADTQGLYGDYEAWGIFDRVDRGRLGIQPLFFREVFFCARCGGHVTDGVCPHADRVAISGTRVRASLKAGETPPDHAMRPEVLAAVRDALVP